MSLLQTVGGWFGYVREPAPAGKGVTVEPVPADQEGIPFIRVGADSYTPRQYLENELARGNLPYHAIVGLADHVAPEELAEVLRGVNFDRTIAGKVRKTLVRVTSEPLPTEFAEHAWPGHVARAQALRGLELFLAEAS